MPTMTTRPANTLLLALDLATQPGSWAFAPGDRPSRLACGRSRRGT